MTGPEHYTEAEKLLVSCQLGRTDDTELASNSARVHQAWAQVTS